MWLRILGRGRHCWQCTGIAGGAGGRADFSFGLFKVRLHHFTFQVKHPFVDMRAEIFD